MDSSIGCVIDLGSENIKGGYSINFPNDIEPRAISPCCATVVEADGNAQIGDKPHQIVHPITAGSITDWEVLESILHYVLYDQLGWIEGEEGNLLIAEPIMSSRDERELLAQLAFERFGVSSYFAADQAVLSLYSIGKVSGIVVDVGLEKIDVSPVLDGLLQQSATVRLPYGGKHLTHYLQKLFSARGNHSLPFEAADALKKSCIAVPSLSTHDGEEQLSVIAPQPTTHTLPDGQTITIHDEGQKLGEAFMDPGLLGLTLPSLAHAVQTAGMVTTLHGERETRKALIENIMLCGGGSCASGSAERLLAEVKELAHPSLMPALCACPPYMPETTFKHASWMGGAILAKAAFSPPAAGNNVRQAVTKGEYDEVGPGAVHRKCS